MARGRVKKTIYTRVLRVRLTDRWSGLLPFFERLDGLPRGKRSDALLEALQYGVAQSTAASAQQQRAESAKVERAISNILDGLGE